METVIKDEPQFWMKVDTEIVDLLIKGKCFDNSLDVLNFGSMTLEERLIRLAEEYTGCKYSNLNNIIDVTVACTKKSMPRNNNFEVNGHPYIIYSCDVVNNGLLRIVLYIFLFQAGISDCNFRSIEFDIMFDRKVGSILISYEVATLIAYR